MKVISFSILFIALVAGNLWAGNIATNSVLASGNWYKISVSQTGVHKIDYTLLKSIGIDPDNIDPRNIRIYGNGGGVLPELNSVARHDDLVQNPIMVVGEGDGRFDAGDYILFYAEGPSLWSYNAANQAYNYDANPYSDLNYYFITVDLGQGNRVANAPASGTANQFTNTFDELQQHEVDEVNIGSTGREWMGEFFNFSIPSRSISFNIPNVVSSEPVTVTSEFGAKSNTSTSSVTLRANGQVLDNATVASVGTSYTDNYANLANLQGTLMMGSGNLNVEIAFANASSAAEGYLNYIKVHARRNLVFNGTQFNFRDARTTGPGNITEYTLQASGNPLVWDVTDAVNAQNITYSNAGGQLKFTVASDVLREFVVFNQGGSFPAPGVVGKVPNQDLHSLGQPDMIVLVTPALRSEAERFAQYRSAKSGLYVQVVELEQIYNEFSSGRADLSAIRDFMRMLYVRAQGNAADEPQYLLLFGHGTFDFKGVEFSIETTIPTYQTPNSHQPVNSYASDDYFAMLDDNEGSMSTANLDMDLAVGRFPVRSLEEARIMVDKVIHYESLATFGSWRNNVTFIGDDEDGNTHLNHAEGHSSNIATNHPVYNIDKIYLDAYKLEVTPAGARYPGVNDAVNAKMFNGCLMMNYTGHGGPSGWAHERILTIDDIRSWDNYDAMPLFVTATCEFTRYDDPARISAGEELVLNPKGGAIASVSTSRLVFAHANERTNRNFINNLFALYNGRFPTIGEVVMLTKNATSSSLDISNDRKFGLYGDPSLTLAYPKYNVVTTAVNEQLVGTVSDTLKALQQVTISGEVRNWDGTLMTDFNGVVYPTIFDKPVTYETLGNSNRSNKTDFEVQKNIIFRGKASVKEGKFTFTFIVPKDIAYNYGQGKISYYADNGQFDAHGYQDDLYIGGMSNDYADDNQGPDIEVFMNDDKFISGGITDANPYILVKLYDASGINTVGNGIGHDLVAVMNEDTRNTYVLNDFYESETDDFRRGTARYPLFNLPDGRYKVMAKAWDVHNNSAEDNTEFVVTSNPCISLEEVFNYPNPFNYSTKFQFEHNKPGETLFVDLKIFDYSGRLVKHLTKAIESAGFRIDDLEWDGQTDNGMNLSNGTYVYRLEVRTEECSPVHQTEKLVILR